MLDTTQSMKTTKNDALGLSVGGKKKKKRQPSLYGGQGCFFGKRNVQRRGGKVRRWSREGQ